MKANAEVDDMNNHPIQYGPSLRRIADKYFPGAAAAGSTALDTALVSGSINPAHKERAWAMSNHVRAVSKPAKSSALAAGDIVLFKAFNSQGQRGLEPLLLGGETPFLLDSPCPNMGPHAWNAWVTSGYTAYATNWEVFVPWDEEQWPYDPAACVIHANRRVILHVDMASTVSVRVSPTCLASVRAVSDEFLEAAVTGAVRPSAVQVTERGERVTLGGLKVRTGRAIERDDEPRLVLSRMLLALVTELNDFAQAWAFSESTSRSGTESLLSRLRSLGVSAVDLISPTPRGPSIVDALDGAQTFVFDVPEIDGKLTVVVSSTEVTINSSLWEDPKGYCLVLSDSSSGVVVEILGKPMIEIGKKRMTFEVTGLADVRAVNAALVRVVNEQQS